jgi:hypothetical protein
VSNDDRALCTDCRNYRFGTCGAAYAPGVVWGGLQVPPEVREVPLRCMGWKAKPDHPDQRPAAKRWPGLANLHAATKDKPHDRHRN